MTYEYGTLHKKMKTTFPLKKIVIYLEKIIKKIKLIIIYELMVII